MRNPQLSASACVFLRCCWCYTSQSSGNEINLLGMSEGGKTCGPVVTCFNQLLQYQMCESPHVPQDTGLPLYWKQAPRWRQHLWFTEEERQPGSHTGCHARGLLTLSVSFLSYFFYPKLTSKRQIAEGSLVLAEQSQAGKHQGGWCWRPPLSWSWLCPQDVVLHVSLHLLLMFTSRKIWIGPI